MSIDFWDGVGDKLVFKAFGKKVDVENALTKIISPFCVTYLIKNENCDNYVAVNLSTLSKEDKRKLSVKVFNGLEDKIYSDSDISLPKCVIELLKIHEKKLGVAESLTGGLIASSIVGISGASEVFNEGLVCYSNLAKHKVLGVKKDTLIEHSAVSSQTAYEMACGVLKHEYNDYAISTTGYAENYDGEQNGGRVFIAVGSKDRIDVHEYKFEGDRTSVRLCATNSALFHLIKRLKGSFDYIR